jgi:hypothetical protein
MTRYGMPWELVENIGFRLSPDANEFARIEIQEGNARSALIHVDGESIMSDNHDCYREVDANFEVRGADHCQLIVHMDWLSLIHI